MSIPEIDLTDVAVLRDLPTAYARAREQAPVARLLIPGFPMWAVLRHDAAKAMLADSRFALSSNSYQHPAVPDGCRPYLRSLQEMEGAEHARLRRLVSPAFTPRRAAQLRPRIARIVGSLLDGLAADDGPVDLVSGLARPLPMEVICEVVGIPEVERARWHTYGAAVASGRGDAFAEAIPAIVGDAKAAVARRREEPADDLLSDLVRARTDDGDQLHDVEIVALVWLLVLAGQTPTNLIANAVAALLTHPAQLAALRADPELLPGAVDELMRWCGPQLLTVPRFAGADAAIAGVPIPEGAAVTVSILAANRDPRVFPDPDRLDLARPTGTSGHLGFAHGPHFCLGAALARAQTAVALDMLLSRWPDLRLACDVSYQPDPATWRLAALPVHI